MTDAQSTHGVKAYEILYRLRGVNGDLLYVGITRDWPTRMKQHQADKPWWCEVAGIELVRVLGTRQQIEAIEKAVIKAERPIYNVVHNERPTTDNPFRQHRYGASSGLSDDDRQQIINLYSDHGPEWHRFACRGYQAGWMVEHPEYGFGRVLHCDDDTVHGDVRIQFEDDAAPYRCLSIQWAPLKVGQ